MIESKNPCFLPFFTEWLNLVDEHQTWQRGSSQSEALVQGQVSVHAFDRLKDLVYSSKLVLMDFSHFSGPRLAQNNAL